jgi:hypothetical protein
MPLSADDVLANAESIVYLLECNLPNSIPHTWDNKEHVGGLTPLGLSKDSSVYRSNAYVRLSTEPVRNGQAMPLMLSGVTLTTKLGEPFKGSGASVSIANLAIMNTRTSDPDFDAESQQLLSDLSDRRFKGRDVTIKVGGLLYKGTPEENDMAYDDFVVLLEGRFKSHSLNNNQIDVSIEARQDDLGGLFPVNTDIDGKAKPFGFGTYLGYQCKPEGNGLWRFHDEVFSTADTEYSKTAYPPFAYFGYGRSFYQGENLIAIVALQR